jgi:hypothetical protein
MSVLTNSELMHPTEDRLHRLDKTFAESISALHERLESMLKCRPFIYSDKPSRLPRSVVYLFSENGIPLYVGRSNKFSQRLGNHCRESSTANQSALAFKLAREEAGIEKAAYVGAHTRKQLMLNPKFKKGFKKAKFRLNAMQIRYVEEPIQVSQALLEIYCAVALKTRFNTFHTH